MKYRLLFLLLFCIVAESRASRDTTTIHLLKLNPFSLIDFDNSFNLGYERFITRNKSLQAEAGYGNTNFNLWMDLDDNDQQYRGFHVVKFRTEYRQYKLSQMERLPDGAYFGVELYGKSVFKNDPMRVGRGVIAGTPQYWEYVDATRRKNVLAAHIKLGTQFYVMDDFLKKKRRLLADIFLGLGVRVVDNHYDYENKRPDDFQTWDRRVTFANLAPPNRATPYVSAVLGFKLCYLL